MRSKSTLIFATIVALALSFTGCSVGKSEISTPSTGPSLVPMQKNEIAATKTTIEEKIQTVSVGIPLNGGQYSPVLGRKGEDTSSTVVWQDDKHQDQGKIKVICTPEGGTVQEQIDVNGFSSSLSFIVNELQGRDLSVSIAPTHSLKASKTA
ncbi:hypothetical protein ACX5K5_04125 [Glutamicibacter bergerei]|uniref:hypothetical protein n=1 Tax=Glutamicibacter sp. BW77 TaxID=2024402 RepID=UPI001144775A|nr:hypothetical protein [Glutamicibacter sp. BW77]